VTTTDVSWPLGKVTPRHRDRLAVVYVRQSTPQQVIDHGESTRLQYGLTARAVELGWAPSRVLVIDEDLGHSASGLDARPGFARLVSEVGLDHVGLVLGVEMSRLARSGREWHQLLELCALSSTLLADPQGVYDPTDHNDRLLLGLKGTISEAELWLIKQRMWSGRITKAQRGELAVPLPVGYVRRPGGEVVFDPDEQVRAVVRLVFDLFDQMGTVNGVLRYLADNGIQVGVRIRQGSDRGELSWRRPSRVGVQNMLRNPAYAGVYVYGRSRLDPRRRQPGRPHTGRVRQARADWQVWLPDRLPAYVSLDRYEQNLQRMETNRARAESMGAVRDGPALLAGLVVCGRCHTRMTVRYQRGPGGRLHPVYVCSRDKSDYGGVACQQLAGGCVDTHVRELLLAALAPAALEVSLAAAEQITARRAEVERIWVQRLERADYTVDRARRQYQLAEPENRLVVRQLERDWEQAMTERRRLGEEHDRFLAARPRLLSDAERAQIRAVAADIPGLWHADTTTDSDRKQLARCLIERVDLTVLGDSERVRARITWSGGYHSDTELIRPVARLTQLSYYPQLTDRIRQLAVAGNSPAQIAEQLNADGLRPPKRRDRFGPQGVRDIMLDLGLAAPGTPRPHPAVELPPNQWWRSDLARHLGMPDITLYSWITRGWVTAHQHPDPPHRWIIHADPTEIDRLRTLHQRPHHTRPIHQPPDREGNGLNDQPQV
jgi:DNA invertase Pin-like site-specific DNA recombinase